MSKGTLKPHYLHLQQGLDHLRDALDHLEELEILGELVHLGELPLTFLLVLSF